MKSVILLVVCFISILALTGGDQPLQYHHSEVWYFVWGVLAIASVGAVILLQISKDKDSGDVEMKKHLRHLQIKEEQKQAWTSADDSHKFTANGGSW
jgi:hypothetical protein